MSSLAIMEKAGFLQRIGRTAAVGVFLISLLPTHVRADASTPRKRREGVILFKLRPDATPAQIAAAEKIMASRRSGAGALGVASGGAFRKSHRAIAVATAGATEESIAADLRKTGAVAFAEPDYLETAAFVPNDPDYSLQWHHAHINSPGAWDVTLGNTAIVAAVVDSGVDASHPDFGGKILRGYNVVDGTDNSGPIADHGTEVAGTLAAVGNNGQGVAGVAWNVKILPVRITNSPDTSAWCSDMAAGIEWAADHGAKVINLSYNTTGCPNLIDSAAQYAHDKGALVFVAAGNQGVNLTGSFPTNASYVLIGATDNQDVRATFSNYGSPIDLVAPGVSIRTTKPGASYAAPSGTSFACPIAAGVGALLYSIKPEFSPDDVRQLLITTAHDVGPVGDDTVYGHGMVDAQAAVVAAKSILDGNHAPSLQVAAPLAAIWPAPVALSADVTDDGLPNPPAKVSLQWSKVSGPGTVSFKDTVSTTTSATFSYAGRYVLRATADDGALHATRDVTVVINPGPHGEGGLPAPTLAVPSVISVKSQIRASYPSGYSIAEYQWTFQPASQGSQSTAQAGTIAASWSTTNSSADLGTRSLAPGYYRIIVQAFDTQGVISEPAEAYTTLVPADLSTMRAFPNPWRSDKHTGKEITFDQLSLHTTIKLFTLAGQFVRALSADDEVKWDLKNEAGDPVASGFYLYVARDDSGQKHIGKLIVIH